MRTTEPKVYLIAEPQINWNGVEEYLATVGGEAWHDRKLAEPDPTSDGSALIEFAGRLCYRSWKPGLNPNVKKVREDSQEYFNNILSTGHGSVLEHANYSFLIANCSRVATHEIVRHRAGMAYSQESLRFVRLTDIPLRLPEELYAGLHNDQREKLDTAAKHLVGQMEAFQKMAADMHQLDEGDTSFAQKKVVTSAMRRLAPEGVSTNILMTGNVRALRHVITMRTAKSAEEEMRTIFRQVGAIMRDAAPMLFADYTENEEGEWVTEWRKV